MPVRLIATDIDGTLLNNASDIPRENVEIIRESQRRGIPVVIASGRFPENVFVKLEEYGLNCPIIGTNGAQLTDQHLHSLAYRPMDRKAAERVLDVLEAFQADYFIFGNKAVCTGTAGLRHHSEISCGDRIRSLGVVYTHGRDAARDMVRGQTVYKFFVCNNQPLPPIREALLKEEDILVTQSNPHNVEVMPAGVDKALGIRTYAGLLGIPLSDVMALGDEENDLPMLTAVGWGVAMGNGSEATRAAARFVTDTNEHCGFAAAIRKYAFQEG